MAHVLYVRYKPRPRCYRDVLAAKIYEDREDMVESMCSMRFGFQKL